MRIVRSMKISPKLSKVFWLLPIIMQCSDAHAWGLMTHLYFAHSLLWAMPLLDPRLQQAIRKFPELVMAGSCLPDLAIVSPAFRHTHHWENAHQLMASAKTEEETAIAIGYASHLYVDVIAHNHFVPAHEAMWLDKTMFTHIASEWAMDAHLSPLMQYSPGQLLTKYHDILQRFVSPNFRCSKRRTSRALKALAFWDKVLRQVKLPHMIYRSMRLLDKRVHTHFIYYIAKTQTAIIDIGIVLNGHRPAWNPELTHLNESELSEWRRACREHLAEFHPSPIQYFESLDTVIGA